MFDRPCRSVVSLSNIGACRAPNSALPTMTSMRPLRTKANDFVMESSIHCTGGASPQHPCGGKVVTGGPGRSGQVEQVAALVLVQLQCPGHGFQHGG